MWSDSCATLNSSQASPHCPTMSLARRHHCTRESHPTQSTILWLDQQGAQAAVALEAARQQAAAAAVAALVARESGQARAAALPVPATQWASLPPPPAAALRPRLQPLDPPPTAAPARARHAVASAERAPQRPPRALPHRPLAPRTHTTRAHVMAARAPRQRTCRRRPHVDQALPAAAIMGQPRAVAAAPLPPRPPASDAPGACEQQREGASQPSAARCA